VTARGTPPDRDPPETRCADCDAPHGPSGRQNNGLGNGDQTAPGNSLSHNRAENRLGNPGHASGKSQNSN